MASPDYTLKGKQAAVCTIENHKGNRADMAKILIGRFKNGEDTYSKGIVAGCREWLAKGNA